MARRKTNPWNKKSKKGMKILMGAVTTSYKVGKAVAKASSSSKPASANKGCTVFLIMLCISVIAIAVITRHLINAATV